MGDLKFAFRQLAKSPGFTAVALLTLALGIGANTSIFSLVNSVLLRPLPYDNSSQLVRVFESSQSEGLQRGPISLPNFNDWRSQATVFESLAAFHDIYLNLTGTGEPKRLEATCVSAEFFSLLRVHPLLGRTFSPDEERGGRVVILSYGLWQQRFGGAADVVGNTITLDKNGYSVVGVMPREFKFPYERDLWAPLHLTEGEEAGRGTRMLRAVGRLKSDVGLQQAQAEMHAIGGRLAQQFSHDHGWNVEVVPLHADIVSSARPALLLLCAGVGFVLLIACANLANLSLAKAAARQREIAVRVALGARRGRIIRQLLAESLLLSCCGGALGIVIAFWATRALASFVPQDLPHLQGPGIDARVLAFTIVISVLTGILFGLLPALQLSRPDLNSTLKESSRGSTGARNRLHWLSVVSEMALALILLSGTGLLLKSFLRLRAVDPGFQADNVLTLQLSLPESKYPQGYQQAAFFEQLVQRIQALPGVQHAAAAPTLPLSGGLNSYGFNIDGREAQPGDNFSAEHDAVTADYFRALGIRLLQGRLFTDHDKADSPPVIVINQAAARRFFPNENPIGRRVTIAGPAPGEIIGVVADVKQYALTSESPPHMYSPQSQKPSSHMTLFIRSSGEPMNLVGRLHQAVYSVDKDQPIAAIRTLADVAAASLAQRWFTMMLLGIFAFAALVLAAVGIYGVMAFTVSQRTREIGLRLALGAQKRNVLAIVIARGMAFTLIGLGVGLVSALVLSRLLSSLLFEVTPSDPLTFVGMSLLLMLVALSACWLPAHRATNVDPMEALRYE
jgi:putative ABC transport system permease protein